MSLILGSFLILAVLVCLVSTGIAVAQPRLRVAATIVACIGFLGAVTCVGVFVVAISRMA